MRWSPFCYVILSYLSLARTSHSGKDKPLAGCARGVATLDIAGPQAPASTADLAADLASDTGTRCKRGSVHCYVLTVWMWRATGGRVPARAERFPDPGGKTP